MHSPGYPLFRQGLALALNRKYSFAMTSTLTVKITKKGIVNYAGATPESKATLERLLEEDRQKHHCFWGKFGFHNHLNHQ